MTQTESELLAAIELLTVWSSGEICFLTKNGIPMAMNKKQERAVRAAIARAALKATEAA